jgi:hypothetical protein
MAYEVNLGDGVCVIPGSIELLIPSVIPALTIEYGDECDVPPIDCLEWTASADGFPGMVYYTDCAGDPQEIFVDTTLTFCAIGATSGGPILSINGDCI